MKLSTANDLRVLVLDVSFAPITVVPWQRAVALMMDTNAKGIGRAVAVVERDIIVSSPSVDVVLPSVIRLTERSVKFKRRPAVARRRAVFLRDNWTCAYCLKREVTQEGQKRLTIDHIQPKSRGGSKTDVMNLVTSCGRCNLIKADRTPEEARMKLLIEPRPLTWNEQVRMALLEGREAPELWVPFLPALTAA
jgi:5-methylcytosine-specific restriction endonuclease McrA